MIGHGLCLRVRIALGLMFSQDNDERQISDDHLSVGKVLAVQRVQHYRFRMSNHKLLFPSRSDSPCFDEFKGAMGITGLTTATSYS